jgi:hypothetical protein
MFLEFIPPELDEATMCVSVPYATTVHRRACGCRNKVVPPLNPAEWQMYFDGESISLTSYVGNWEFPCHALLDQTQQRPTGGPSGQSARSPPAVSLMPASSTTTSHSDNPQARTRAQRNRRRSRVHAYLRNSDAYYAFE